MSKVSILMNGYNAERFLRQAIESIFQQTFQEWELIFIDNCSTDTTASIVHQFDNSKIKYFKTDRTIPLGDARNFGLKKCTGKFIAFLDTDDLWEPTKLERQMHQLERYPEFVLSYSSANWINEAGDHLRTDYAICASGNMIAEQLLRYEINMQSVLLRRSFLEVHNLSFDTTLSFSPDYNLFMQLLLHHPAGVIKEPLVSYRLVEGSLSQNRIDVWGHEMRTTLDTLRSHLTPTDPKITQALKTAYAKAAFYDAQAAMHHGKPALATKALHRYRFVSWRYFFLYLLSMSSPPFWRFILRKLK